MLDQLEEQLEEDELNNNESEPGKTDSTLSSDQINYSMTETESGSDPKAHVGNETSIFDHQLFNQFTKVPLRKLYLTKTETENIILNGLNIKNFVPTYARFSFGQVRGLTPLNSSDSDYATEPETESEGENITSNPQFNQAWSTSDSWETESSLDSEDKAIMRERRKEEGIIFSDDTLEIISSDESSLDLEDMKILRENSDIDYIRGRSNWKCPETKTNTFCWICNADVGNKPGSERDNSACCEHGRGDDESGEETESEMDISENLVQDSQGKCITV